MVLVSFSASDINTAVVDSLKVLDLKRPIREADIKMASGSNSLKRALLHFLHSPDHKRGFNGLRLFAEANGFIQN
jgi:hypothetical protein